ncbi:MAG: oligosaccharide flippase family protein [Deltaproteobacteria bacterium]|nr:oligosaccharide flippase family protein [Deltaproteobacteria bacterium]
MTKAVSAGRGVLYIAAAKLYFMIAGYAIYFTLPRLFGNPVDWGNYLLVVGLVSVIDNVIVTGTIQAVSRFTAQGDESPDAVKKTALRAQLIMGGGVAAVYFLLAPLIAALQKDESLVGLYRISAGIVFCYAFYAVFVGSVNGERHFGKQALLDTSFATIRATLILGAAALGWGVAGTVGAFVSAAATILVISLLWVGLPARGTEGSSMGELWRFALPLFGYTFFVNAVMRVDLIMLKRFAADLPALGQSVAAQASVVAGYYGTAQSLAFIPYQAILSVAFVIFPLVSRSTFVGDLETTRSYVKQTLRLSFLFVMGVASVLIANPSSVIAVVYPERYVFAGEALRILAGGMVSFSLFTIINTILNGAGLTRDTLISGIITAMLALVANIVAVPHATSAGGMLLAAAWATSLAMTVGLGISAVFLYRRFGAGLGLVSLVRGLLAAALAVAVGEIIPTHSKLVTLGECVVVFGVYVGVLLLTRELRLAELKQLRSRK